jgi:hypothetical protein
MRQPPAADRRASDPPVCSTGRGGVALDVLVAVALGAGALAAMDQDEEGAALGLGLVSGLFVASAISGHNAATRCEEASQSFETYRTVAGAEARDRRADDREARGGTTPAPAPAPGSVSGTRTETETETETESESETETETDAESETDAETETAQEQRPPAPPVPGSQAWREFWIEVAP